MNSLSKKLCWVDHNLVADMKGKHQGINFQTQCLLINQAPDHLTNKKMEELFLFGLGERPDPSHVVFAVHILRPVPSHHIVCIRLDLLTFLHYGQFLIEHSEFPSQAKGR